MSKLTCSSVLLSVTVLVFLNSVFSFQTLLHICHSTPTFSPYDINSKYDINLRNLLRSRMFLGASIFFTTSIYVHQLIPCLSKQLRRRTRFCPSKNAIPFHYSVFNLFSQIFSTLSLSFGNVLWCLCFKLQ